MLDPTQRIDFLFYVDIEYGNPNGDPDNENQPRMDPDTGRGLMTSVSLKRKLRDYVLVSQQGREGFDIFYQAGPPLSEMNEDLKKDAPDAKDRIALARRRFWDTRMFGSPLMTKGESIDVKGPVQVGMGVSVDPITVMDVAITRVVNQDKGGVSTFGSHQMTPYGLYRFTGSYTPMGSAVSSDDLSLMWESFQKCFDLDRAANRHLQPRLLVVFAHENPLGNAPSHALYDLVHVQKREGVDFARSFSDYTIQVGNAPAGVSMHRVIG